MFVSINGTLGNIGVYNNEKIILGKSTCYFNVLDSISKDFIRYILTEKRFQEYIVRYATGTTIKNASLRQMRNYVFSLPPLPEQRAIAATLSCLDDKVELNTRINANLEAQAQAIFKHWFVDFEFPDANGNPYKSSGGEMVGSELGPIPKGWRVGTLSEIGDIVGGATPSKDKEEYYTVSGNGIAWITPKDLSINKNKFISHGEIDITELGYKKASTKLMPHGSVLFSSRAPIGYMAISDGEVCTNQGFKSVVPKEDVGNGYIYYTLKYMLNEIQSLGSGSTFKEVSGSVMKSVQIIIPKVETLKAFQHNCNSIFKYQKLLGEQSNTLVTIRATLLPKLMSGEIEVV